MIFSMAQTYGISPIKVILVALQLTAVFFYTPKKFLIDLQFMTQKKTSLFTKLTIFILLPLGLLNIGFELRTSMNLFSYIGKPLPTWAIGNHVIFIL